jgi:transposase
MTIIGCDFHPSFQQIAWVDKETGECGERRLPHANGEAASFYRSLQGKKVCVGVEATGGLRWFLRLLAGLQFEVRMGDPARIRAAMPRKQKTDKRDAEHMLQGLSASRPTRQIPPSRKDVCCAFPCASARAFPAWPCASIQPLKDVGGSVAGISCA